MQGICTEFRYSLLHCLFIRQLIGSGSHTSQFSPMLPVPTLREKVTPWECIGQVPKRGLVLSPEQFSETLRLTEEFRETIPSSRRRYRVAGDGTLGGVCLHSSSLPHNRSSLTLANGAGISVVRSSTRRSGFNPHIPLLLYRCFVCGLFQHT